MDTLYDPDRFASDLRQVLSPGRKRIGLLVGAGMLLSVKMDGAGRLVPKGESLISWVEALTVGASPLLSRAKKLASAKLSANR